MTKVCFLGRIDQVLPSKIMKISLIENLSLSFLVTTVSWIMQDVQKGPGIESRNIEIRRVLDSNNIALLINTLNRL
jgi:hypothetical protein